MVGSEVLTVTYGLGSALAWGAGDFSGGFASKKGSALTVIFYSQMIGVLLLGALHALFPGGVLAVRHHFMGRARRDLRCAGPDSPVQRVGGGAGWGSLRPCPQW